MNHLAILKRMWTMLWKYRALWVFGAILALTTSSGGGGSGSSGARFSGGDGQSFGIGPLTRLGEQFERYARQLGLSIQRGDLSFLLGWVGTLALVLCGLGLLFAIAMTVARFVAETAAIRMVDDYEATGTQKTVGQGFRLGWSRAAVRLFFIGLVVTLPILIMAILFFALAGLPLLAWTSDNVTAGVFGTIVAIGLFFLGILALIVVAIVARVLVRLAWRAAVLEGLDVFAALRRSWALIKAHLGDVALMWLIMVGVGLGFGLLMIPVGLFVFLLSGMAGGAILLLVRLVSGLFASGAAPWVIGALLGVPVFIVLLLIPLTFVSGLFKVYESGVWTLAFRELTAPDGLDKLVVPDLEPEPVP